MMNSLRDYLSLQNMIEVLMISLSLAFFAIENITFENDETGIYKLGKNWSTTLFFVS